MRAAVLESALMDVPLPHVVCIVHDVLRCDVATMNVFAGHAEHVRFLVLDSALMNCPLLHVGCSWYCPLDSFADGWYELAGTATQALFLR